MKLGSIRLRGLKLKFGAIILGLFILWTSLGIYVNFFRLGSMATEEVGSEARLSAVTLSAAIANDMLHSDYDAVEKVVGALSGDEAVEYVEVIDSVGGVVSRAGNKNEAETAYRTLDITSDDIALGTVTVGLSSAGSREAMKAYFAWHALTVMLLGLVSLFVLVFSFNRLVLRPLEGMNDILKGMAKGGGDLTRRIEVNTSDEIGELAEGFNAFMASLRDLVAKARKSAFRVLELSERVGDKSKLFMDRSKEQVVVTNDNFKAIEEMDRAVQEVAGSAESLSINASEGSATVTEMAAQVDSVADSTIDLTGNVDETSSSISEMAGSIREVAENVTALSDMASQVASSISEIEASIKEVEERAKESARLSQEVAGDADTLGNEAIARTIEGMDRIKLSVEDASDVIDRLGSRSVEIDKIVKVIDEVTNQTSLLALNAAILAAQAGEHGKGFEVVANEIKDLAERTSSSTGEIAKLIKTVQQESGAAVDSMRVGRERVIEGVQMAYGASDALTKILESSTRSRDTATKIEAATTQQVEAVRQVTAAILKVHDRVRSIEGATREQTKGSDLIASAARKISDFASEVKKAMSEQARAVKEFANSIDETREMADTIADAMKGQSSGSVRLIGSMEKFLDIAQGNSENSGELEGAAGELIRQAGELRDEMGRFKVD